MCDEILLELHHSSDSRDPRSTCLGGGNGKDSRLAIFRNGERKSPKLPSQEGNRGHAGRKSGATGLAAEPPPGPGPAKAAERRVNSC